VYEIEPTETRPYRSGFGTASLILGVLSLLGACLVAFLVVFPEGPRLLGALGLCGGGILAITGFGLGVAGVVQSQSKAVSILGIVLNTLYISLGVVLLLVLLLQAYMFAALP